MLDADGSLSCCCCFSSIVSFFISVSFEKTCVWRGIRGILRGILMEIKCFLLQSIAFLMMTLINMNIQIYKHH